MCDHCGCRDHPAIAELSEEHETILRLAWRVAEQADDDARRSLVELLGRHVAKEEEGLYPQLVGLRSLDPGTVAALEEEHDTIDGAVTGLRVDRRAFYELAAHIEQEEMELFPAAMFAFDDAQWASLREVHARVDQPAGQSRTSR